MRANWGIVVGALSGATAAVIWAMSLAIYQPLMQPHGFWTEGSTGRTFPELAGNNTYWPRETRQLAILLAFAGVILICRASLRGIVAGGIATIIWLGADLWLDRLDVSGTPTAVWLALAGIAAFTVVAVAATRMSAGRPGTVLARHLAATVGAVLAIATLLVTTPWDEPVTDPDNVRVEDALSVFKAGLVVMFAAVAIGLVLAQAPARIRRLGFFAALTATAGWLAFATTGGSPHNDGLLALPVVAALAVAAARDVPSVRLFFAAVVCGVALLPAVMVLLLFVGPAVGRAMTSLAGSPAVNSADTDLSLSFTGLGIGLLLASISYVIAVRGMRASWRLRMASSVERTS